MFDPATAKGRILTAALDLAAKKNWADVTLLDVAEGAGVSLGELLGAFKRKNDIVAALLGAVDEEVLKRLPKRGEDEEKRDRLFDVIMTRFDVLAPHKSALKSMYASSAADFSLLGNYLSSQHAMLEAAGIGTDGAAGGLRIAGLALTYASVFRVWLEDEDRGVARTMAALDRRLRRGEQAIGSLDRVAVSLNRLIAEGPGLLRALVRGRPRPRPTPERESRPSSERE